METDGGGQLELAFWRRGTSSIFLARPEFRFDSCGFVWASNPEFGPGLRVVFLLGLSLGLEEMAFDMDGRREREMIKVAMNEFCAVWAGEL